MSGQATVRWALRYAAGVLLITAGRLLASAPSPEPATPSPAAAGSNAGSESLCNHSLPGTAETGRVCDSADSIPVTVFQVNAISPAHAVVCKSGSVLFSATTEPSGCESSLCWEATTGTLSPSATGTSVTWTPPQGFVSTTADDVTITAKCSSGDSAVTATVTVVDITRVQVRRQNSGIAFGPTAIVAVGAKSSAAHKADVQFTIAPVPAGTFAVSIPVRVTGGGGYAGDPIPATLGSASLPRSGTVPISFTNANTNASGEQTEELISSNKVEDCTIARDSVTATVVFSWDRDDAGPYDFSYPDYFVPGIAGTVKFYPTVHENAGEGALAGHHIPFYTYSATILCWTYNLATGTMSEVSEAMPTTPAYAGIPFGQTIATLVQQTPTAATAAGEYSNSETVQDYYDIVGDELRVIEVQDYSFAVYDLDVYLD